MSAVRRDWVLGCVLAETLGMTTAASAARAADHLVAAGRGGAAALSVVVAGGLVEGAALGALQGRALRRPLGAAVARRWAVVTTAVAGLGWAAASAPSAFAAQDAGAAEPPRALMLVAAAGLGVSMGLALGAAQALVLRRAVARPWRWAGVSALVWTPTMVVIFAGATQPAADWPFVAVAATGTVTGLAAGATLGLLSAAYLPSIDPALS